jgi:hypothetical protein
LPWTYIHLAASKAHDAYVRAFNAHVAAERPATVQDVNTLFRLEFDDATLHTCAPFIEAAGEEYWRRRDEAPGPVPMKWLSTQKTVPAVGILGAWLREIIDSGKVPDEAKGITMDNVMEACFKRNPQGVFMPMVKYRRQQKPNPTFGAWLADNGRHAYSDIGLAVAHDGLHVSLLSPMDSRVPVMTGNGRWVGWYVDQLNFRCGKKPIRWLIPMDMFLEPDFSETFLLALKKLHVQLRTVVFDASALPNLPYRVRRAVAHSHRWCQAHGTDARVNFDRAPTIGAESRSCQEYFASTGDFDAQMLRAIMSQSSVECPHCRAEVLLETDTSTGAPYNRVETCGNCHTAWPVGLLLAERARVHGAFRRVPEDGYACS